MESRKVQKVGYSTLSVSIPGSWAKKMGIDKGDLIFISDEEDGSLRLTVEPNKIEDNIMHIVNADECDNTKMLARIIVGNYSLGRNTIKVESSRRLMREQIKSIREVTQKLLGIGIIEEGDRHLLLQCSIDPKNFPLSTVVRRLHVITSIMFKETIDSLLDENMELAKDAITRKHEADTIYWLLTRLLNSAQQSKFVAKEIGITNPIDIVQHSLVAWLLERIAERASIISEQVIKLQRFREKCDIEIVERLSQMGMVAFTMFDKAVNSISIGNVKIASDAVDLNETISEEEEKLLKKFKGGINPEITTIISVMAWELKTIAEHSSALAEIAINNVLKEENEICQIREKNQENNLFKNLK